MTWKPHMVFRCLSIMQEPICAQSQFSGQLKMQTSLCLVTLQNMHHFESADTIWASTYRLLFFFKLGYTSRDFNACMHHTVGQDSSCWFLETAQASPHNQDWTEECTAGSLPELL